MDLLFQTLCGDGHLSLELDIAFGVVEIFKVIWFDTAANKFHFKGNELVFHKRQLHFQFYSWGDSFSQFPNDSFAPFYFADQLLLKLVEISQGRVCIQSYSWYDPSQLHVHKAVIQIPLGFGFRCHFCLPTVTNGARDIVQVV